MVIFQVNTKLLIQGASAIAPAIAVKFGEAGPLERSGLVAIGLALFLVTLVGQSLGPGRRQPQREVLMTTLDESTLGDHPGGPAEDDPALDRPRRRPRVDRAALRDARLASGRHSRGRHGPGGP